MDLVDEFGKENFKIISSLSLPNLSKSLEELINDGFNVNASLEDGDYPIFRAISFGNIPGVKVLMKYGVNLEIKDKQGKTPVKFAFDNKNLSMVEVLAEKELASEESDFSKSDYISEARLESLEKLRDKVVSLAEDPDSVLFTHLVYSDNKRFLKNYFKKIDINAVLKDGYTPLHIAVIHGNRCAVKALIESRANVNELDINKETPLDIAVKTNNFGIMFDLEENGAEESPNNIN